MASSSPTPTPHPDLSPGSGQSTTVHGSDTLWRWDVLCVTVCLFFTTIPFALRVYVRVNIRRQWLFEDCKPVPAILLLFAALTVCRHDLSLLGGCGLSILRHGLLRWGSSLTSSQAWLVIYCAMITTLMDRHGGVHQWNLTTPEVKEALYVSRRSTAETPILLTGYVSGSTLVPSHML